MASTHTLTFDFNADTIKILLMEVDGEENKFMIKKTALVESKETIMSRGKLGNIDELAENIFNLLTACEIKKPSTVGISISGPEIFLKRAKIYLPNRMHSDIDARYLMSQYTNFDPEEYSVACHTSHLPDDILSVLYTGVKKTVFKDYSSFFRFVNIHPSSVETLPIVIFRLCLVLGVCKQEETICVMHVGYEDSFIMFIDGFSLDFYQYIPNGEVLFINEIRDELKTTTNSARDMIKTPTKLQNPEKIISVMQPIYKNYFQKKITEVFAIYKAVSGGKKISTCYMSGEGASVYAFSSNITKTFKIKTKILSPFEEGIIKSTPAANDVIKTVDPCSYNAIIGTGLRAVDISKYIDVKDPEQEEEPLPESASGTFSAATTLETGDAQPTEEAVSA